MSGKLRLAGRLRARLRGEVRVFGLSAPATVRFDGGAQVECEQAEDAGIAWGFTAAELGMVAVDLERRLWSGRLAEVLGDVPVAGLPAADLDIFVRLLGMRADAEKRVRGLPEPARAGLDAIAAGLNAWTDAGRWQADPAWKELDSRPRLFGAADLVLLATARRLVAGLPSEAPPRPEGWPSAWTSALTERLRAVRGCFLEPVGRGCDVLDPHLEGIAGEADPARPPSSALHAETVLPGGDDHRVEHGDGWVRMSVSRPDVAVRGRPARRPWLRRTPRGPLVSDVLSRAEAAAPPTGSAFSLAWVPADHPAPPRRPPAPRTGAVRLVPLTEGA